MVWEMFGHLLIFTEFLSSFYDQLLSDFDGLT